MTGCSCPTIGIKVRLALCLLLCGCTEAHRVGVLARETRAADGGSDPSQPLVAAPGLRAADVFDPLVVRQYAIEVAPEDWELIKRFPVKEQYIRGKLTVEGQTYEPIALRFKGARGSLYGCFKCCSTSETLESCPGPEQACYDDSGMLSESHCAKLSMKLDFDNEWGKAHFAGLDRLNVHAPAGDYTAGLRERLAYHVFAQAGVVTPRTASAVITINGEDLGVFTLVEAPSDAFAQEAFGEKHPGNLYKQRWPTISTDASYFESGLENNGKQPDVSRMVELAQALSTASDADVPGILSARLDLPSFLKFFAVDRAIGNFDGPMAFRCKDHDTIPALPADVLEAQEFPLPWEVCQNKNYFFYERLSDQREVLVPWDLNATLIPYARGPAWTDPPVDCDELQWNGRSPQCDPLLHWLATVLYPDYQAAGRALLDGAFQPDALAAQVDAWASVLRPVALEHEPMLNDMKLDQGIGYLKSNLGTLRDQYAQALGLQAAPMDSGK